MVRTFTLLSTVLLSFCISHPRRKPRISSYLLQQSNAVLSLKEERQEAQGKGQDSPTPAPYSPTRKTRMDSKQQTMCASYAAVFSPVQRAAWHWASRVLGSIGQQDALQLTEMLCLFAATAAVFKHIWPLIRLHSIFLGLAYTSKHSISEPCHSPTPLSNWRMGSATEAWDLGGT